MRQLLLDEVRRSVRHAFPEVGDDLLDSLTLDPPRDPSHGDFASNVAFRLKGLAPGNPRSIAETLVEQLGAEDSLAETEVAGPGFINFRIRHERIQAFLAQLADPEARRAMMAFPELAKELGRIQIEFVSANPTGPMNVVSARAAAFGDACVRLLRAAGVDAHSEYYVNDEGNQAKLFGESLAVRFRQAAGQDVDLAEDAYRGEYVTHLGRDLVQAVAALLAEGAGAEAAAAHVQQVAESGGTIRELLGTLSPSSPPPAEPLPLPADVVDAILDAVDLARLGIASMLEGARASLARFGVEFDEWFRESTLHRPDASGTVRLLGPVPRPERPGPRDVPALHQSPRQSRRRFQPAVRRAICLRKREPPTHRRAASVEPPALLQARLGEARRAMEPCCRADRYRHLR